MGRNNHMRRAGHESRRRANREIRDGKLLKVFRMVDWDDSARIAGAIKDLEVDNTIPPIRVPINHRAFILDPRQMPRNFNDAFISGYQFARVISNIDSEPRITDEGYGINFGQISLLAKNRKTLLLELDSERLKRERTALYSILGEASIKGFSELGKRSGHRDGQNPKISIGNFAQPLSKASEGEVLEAISTSLEVTFVSPEDKPDLYLGALQVVARAAG